MQSIQLFHNFLFQTMALCKLLGKGLLVVRHSGIELFFGYIYIINFDVEILSGRKRVSFLLYLIVRNSHGKSSTASLRWNVPTIFSISSSFSRTFLIRWHPCILRPICWHQSKSPFRQWLIYQKQHTDICACIGKYIAWHGDTTEYNFVIYYLMKNFVLNTTFSRNKTCRDNNRSLSCLFNELITCWIKQVYIAMDSFFLAGTLGTPAQKRAGIAAIFSLVSENPF